ncbi:MAG: sodium:calcium antiporter, partial [Patescibacteria group bacterium]
MLLFIVFILAGFYLLIKGADYLVDGSSSIARRLGISTLVIGLTVVAFGTSAPELAVNILSASSGNTELAFGNINGSNIANILLILGMTAWFTRVPIKSRTVVKEIPFMLLAGVILIVLTLDVILEGGAVAQLSRIDGIVLLSFFAIFMYYMFLSIKGTGAAKVEKAKISLPTASLMTVLGLAMLIVGGYLAVQGASGIALALGVSQTFIGLTIVAIGTSLPELVASIVAARKG